MTNSDKKNNYSDSTGKIEDLYKSVPNKDTKQLIFDAIKKTDNGERKVTPMDEKGYQDWLKTRSLIDKIIKQSSAEYLYQKHRKAEEQLRLALYKEQERTEKRLRLALHKEYREEEKQRRLRVGSSFSTIHGAICKVANPINISNNAISATEGSAIPTAANLNQPSKQVAKMSVKNTDANHSIEPSNSDESPQKNTDLQNRLDNSIPDCVTEAPSLDDANQGFNGVDNANLSPSACGMDVEPAPNKFKHLPRKNIKTRYIGNYHQYTKESKVVAVKAGTGTGKTTAIIAEIQRIIDKGEAPYIIILAPREKLCKSTAASLNEKFKPQNHNVNAKAYHYKDVLKMTPKQRITAGVTIIVTTNNSLHHFPEFFDGKRKLHSVFMDEPEAHFDLLATKTNNVPRTIQCVRDCIKHAEISYFMDAHAGDKTHYLIQLFFPEESRRNSDRIMFLAGSYKKWWDHTIEIITDVNYKKSRATVYRMIIEAIEQGKNIAIACVTAKEAAVITNVLNEYFTDKITGCVLADDKKHLISKQTIGDAIIDDDKAVKLFNIVVYSPSISMGVSFDIRNHIDTIFCFAENIEQAPDAKSVMQMMARFRNLVGKKIVMALDTRHLKLSPVDKHERRKIVTKQIKDNRNSHSEVGKDYQSLTELEEEELKLKVLYESLRVKNKNNFYEQVIEFIEHDFSPDNIKFRVAENETDIEKVINQERKRQEQIDSELIKYYFLNPINENNAKEISFKLSKEPSSVTHKEYKALSVYKTLKSLGFNDESSKDELEKIYQLKVDNKISAIYNNENAKMDTPTINRVVAVMTYGVGESEIMKKGLMNKGIFIKTTRKFMSLLVDVANNGIIDKRKNKKIITLIKFIGNNNKTLKAGGINTNGYTKNIEPKIRKWLRDYLGYKVNKKQVRVGKRRQWQYTAIPSKDVIEMVDRRKNGGLDKGAIVKSLIRDSEGATFLVMTKEVEKEIFGANIDKRNFNIVMDQANPNMMKRLTDLYIRTVRRSEPTMINDEIFSENQQALLVVREKIKELNNAIMQTG